MITFVFQALSLFRYIKSSNSRWQEEGIDDSELTEIDEDGTNLNPHEKEKIKSAKLLCYLNLAACNLKLKDSYTSTCACNEALLLDPGNVKAL
jgi:hypothetical protein